MFSGIIEEVGQIVTFDQKSNHARRLVIYASVMLSDIKLGDSIAVNGCCLTVVDYDVDKHLITFDLLEETIACTSFVALGEGAKVNLERSLSFNGRIGGHFVSGHIDGVGTVLSFEKRGKDYCLEVTVPNPFSRYLVAMGCIAVEGISLTVAELKGDRQFVVWLIPHTLERTNLQGRKAGDKVNLEFDLLAKYVERLVSKKQ